MERCLCVSCRRVFNESMVWFGVLEFSFCRIRSFFMLWLIWCCGFFVRVLISEDIVFSFLYSKEQVSLKMK